MNGIVQEQVSRFVSAALENPHVPQKHAPYFYFLDRTVSPVRNQTGLTAQTAETSRSVFYVGSTGQHDLSKPEDRTVPT